MTLRPTLFPAGENGETSQSEEAVYNGYGKVLEFPGRRLPVRGNETHPPLNPATEHAFHALLHDLSILSESGKDVSVHARSVLRSSAKRIMEGDNGEEIRGLSEAMGSEHERGRPEEFFRQLEEFIFAIEDSHRQGAAPDDVVASVRGLLSQGKEVLADLLHSSPALIIFTVRETCREKVDLDLVRGFHGEIMNELPAVLLEWESLYRTFRPLVAGNRIVPRRVCEETLRTLRELDTTFLPKLSAYARLSGNEGKIPVFLDHHLRQLSSLVETVERVSQVGRGEKLRSLAPHQSFAEKLGPLMENHLEALHSVFSRMRKLCGGNIEYAEK